MLGLAMGQAQQGPTGVGSWASSAPNSLPTTISLAHAPWDSPVCRSATFLSTSRCAGCAEKGSGTFGGGLFWPSGYPTVALRWAALPVIGCCSAAASQPSTRARFCTPTAVQTLAATLAKPAKKEALAAKKTLDAAVSNCLCVLTDSDRFACLSISSWERKGVGPCLPMCRVGQRPRCHEVNSCLLSLSLSPSLHCTDQRPGLCPAQEEQGRRPGQACLHQERPGRRPRQAGLSAGSAG